MAKAKTQTPQEPNNVSPATPAMAGVNPMYQMMQMMQTMMGMTQGMPMLDPAAMPFTAPEAPASEDKGLDADLIRPARLTGRLKTQQPLVTGSVLDLLCLAEDGALALGGLPKGCTCALAGPPGKGKTRTALAALTRIAATGMKCAFVVAEEGFQDQADSGRDDLCSRLVKIGMAATGLAEAELEQKTLENLYILESQYHKGQSWDTFIQRYRYLVEQVGIGFVVIDSLNMLDPQKNRTADNLSALKTYNHQHGVTCLCIGQIRDTGLPVGGEALMHTADAVYLVEEMSLGSKEMADFWGGKYRDTIDIIRAVKSVTTPIFPYPVRLGRDEKTGAMAVHAAQPASYAPPSIRG
ncbi:MAG: AAA family ATPase [Vicinamibacteria bacterium]|nr:AAA family ATPase [Vicinamibacteria bacterium]